MGALCVYDVVFLLLIYLLRMYIRKDAGLMRKKRRRDKETPADDRFLRMLTIFLGNFLSIFHLRY